MPISYNEGDVIYFTPFYFPNGKSPAKPKYFIVLKINPENTLLASLPTRSDSIPSNISFDTSQCIELPSVGFNCFVFKEKEEITVCGNSFPFQTHIYGQQLDVYDINIFDNIYKIEGVDYELWGQLKPSIFKKLKACLVNSKVVKRKHIKMLTK